jgi:hypothetical protein
LAVLLRAVLTELREVALLDHSGYLIETLDELRSRLITQVVGQFYFTFVFDVHGCLPAVLFCALGRVTLRFSARSSAS